MAPWDLLALPTALLCLATIVVAFVLFGPKLAMSGTLQSYLKFAYGSFLKPHSGDGSGNQQDALESFYEYQADAYDVTRTALLRGRDDMIRLVAAQLKYAHSDRKPIWVDIGGGTGWNIEQMGRHLDVPTFFKAVYLVDLTPSLLQVAKARFERLGWDNINIVCQDCRYFNLSDHAMSDGKVIDKADLITMSYSLTMIPDFFPVIDMTTSLLSSAGIIGIVDFYAQTGVEFMRRDYVGGFLDRHCTWFNRTFWRTWFEQDRVMFDGGRRDYLEYRFGTKLSINKRNAMLPGLRIPYYIWIGCSRRNASTQLDASCVQTSFLATPHGTSRPDIPLPSVYYQNVDLRTYWHEDLHPTKPEARVSKSRSLSFEDINELLAILSLDPEDAVLAPAGACDDLILVVALEGLAFVHAVSPSASQNHVLELKLAACNMLNKQELHDLYEQGASRDVIMDKLSPCMSSQACQHWLNFGFKGWLSNSASRPQVERPMKMISQDNTTATLARALNKVRIHTANLHDVLRKAEPGSFKAVVVGDLMDASDEDLESHIRSLSNALAMKGFAVLVLEDEEPWHVAAFQGLGFDASRQGSRSWVYTKIRSIE